MKYIIVTLTFLCFTATASEKTAIFDVSRFPESGLMRFKTSNGYVFAVKRSLQSINQIEESDPTIYDSDHEYVNNIYRSIRKDVFITYSPCGDNGGLVEFDTENGFLCGNCAKYDNTGRPLNQCAGENPSNIPEHYYKDEYLVAFPE